LPRRWRLRCTPFLVSLPPPLLAACRLGSMWLCGAWQRLLMCPPPPPLSPPIRRHHQGLQAKVPYLAFQPQGAAGRMKPRGQAAGGLQLGLRPMLSPSHCCLACAQLLCLHNAS
jgi:hypothetical protein